MFRRCCCALSLTSRFVADPTLVNLQGNPNKIEVYRNVVSQREEMLIVEEVDHVLKNDGQHAYDGVSKLDNKVIRNTLVEMFGNNQPYTEFRDFRKKEKRRMPGLIWSPTAFDLFRTFGAGLLGDIPDAGRIVEHSLPGFEMHTEPLSSGRGFLYLNLLSDTVLDFDDEVSGRTGQVYIPQRAMMFVSDEVRWGWRFGEHPRAKHTFVGQGTFRKRVETDVRLSIQVWKFDGRLIDRRHLQEQIQVAVGEKGGVEMGKKGLSAATGGGLGGDMASEGTDDSSGEGASYAGNSQTQPGEGALGGDLVVDNRTSTGKQKSTEDMIRDAGKYKSDFAHVQNVIKDIGEKQQKGESIDEDFLSTQFSHDETDLEYGFDPNDPMKTWDNIEAKMRYYNDRVRSMNYDGSAGGSGGGRGGPAEPKPMDMKEAIQRFSGKDNTMDLMKDLNDSIPGGAGMPPRR